MTDPLNQEVIHKGMCSGCPYDVGKPGTEQAYTLGCLPGVGEIDQLSKETGKAWACHDNPEQMCCGFAATHNWNEFRELLRIEGVNDSRST